MKRKARNRVIFKACQNRRLTNICATLLFKSRQHLPAGFSSIFTKGDIFYCIFKKTLVNGLNFP
ncbi:MAG: hypothetical protein D6814_00205 [Calditrichaeota bacterium]|nr:MAG: hypothetical protein D6814_00205 [Calditrichota bacterium]